MKILILFFSFNLIAANFMSTGDILKRNLNIRNETSVYPIKENCETEKFESCHNITGKNPRYYKVLLNNYIFDQTLKDVYDAEQLQIQQNLGTRETKRIEFLNQMKNICIPALNGSPTNNQVIGCLKALMKYTIRSELAVGNL